MHATASSFASTTSPKSLSLVGQMWARRYTSCRYLYIFCFGTWQYIKLYVYLKFWTRRNEALQFFIRKKPQKLALEREREREREVNEAVNEDVEKNIWRHTTVGFSGAHACPLDTACDAWYEWGMHVHTEMHVMLLDLHTCIQTLACKNHGLLLQSWPGGSSSLLHLAHHMPHDFIIYMYYGVLISTYLTSPLW